MANPGAAEQRSRPAWVIGITGASGLVYAERLIDVLLTHCDIDLHVIVSSSAWRVAQDELGYDGGSVEAALKGLLDRGDPRVIVHSNRDIGASIASGSFRTRGMVIIPCSMKTLAAVRHGMSENLVHRAADVILKEQKKLIVVPRETPLSAIHLENMLALARLNVSIIPAMPGFYHRPTTLPHIIDMMVMRVLDQMSIELDLVTRWGSSE